MITKFIIIVASIIIALGIYAFLYEIKNAPTVDDRDPFLFGDYDEKKDKTLK